MEENGGKKSRWADERVEEVMGNLLRAGVILAAIVVLAGGIFYLIHYGTTSPDYRVFRGEQADLRSVSGILADAIDLHSRGIDTVWPSPACSDPGSPSGIFDFCLCAAA